MTKVEAIERDVQSLTPEELTTFRQWFEEFDARVWDQQLGEDVQAGKLDALVGEALEEQASGSCTEF